MTIGITHVGTTRHNGVKIPLVRYSPNIKHPSPFGTGFHSQTVGESRYAHMIGMSTRKAGPSIFAMQKRMGVGKAPLHLKAAPAPKKRRAKK